MLAVRPEAESQVVAVQRAFVPHVLQMHLIRVVIQRFVVLHVVVQAAPVCWNKEINNLFEFSCKN